MAATPLCVAAPAGRTCLWRDCGLLMAALSAPVTLETGQRVLRDLDEAALRFKHDPECRTPAGLFARLDPLSD